MREAGVSPEDVIGFWFGALDGDGMPAAAASQRWFDGGEAFDEEIRRRFGALVDAALDGGVTGWEAEPRGRLALVIALDQFTRNLFRGDARSYAGDARALALARDAVATGLDAQLQPVERIFLYLPFEHAEDPAAQERSCALFAALAEDAPEAGRAFFEISSEHAERHRAAIARFGRFPARNAALGRESTAEERAYLAENPVGF